MKSNRNPAQSSPPRWISTREAANLAGCLPETWMRWHHAGRPGFPRPKQITSRTYRWNEREVLAWLGSTVAPEGAASA